MISCLSTEAVPYIPSAIGFVIAALVLGWARMDWKARSYGRRPRR